MQNLSLHIEYLLRYHDCVIVPGIGAFMRTRDASRVDHITGSITPAREYICFNSSILTDDGLLAHSVSRKSAISFEQARMQVADTCEAIRRVLIEDGEIRLGNIGALKSDEAGIISFLPGVVHKLVLPTIAPRKKANVAGMAEEISAERPANNYYTLRIPRKLVRYAAMLALVLMGAFSLSLPVSDMPGKTDHASVLPLPKAVERVNTKSNDQVAEAECIQQAPVRYFLIVGASRSEKKCDEFIAQHPGFRLNKVNKGSTSILIYVESSSSREELLQSMRSEEVMNEFGQTWIYDIATN